MGPPWLERAVAQPREVWDGGERRRARIAAIVPQSRTCRGLPDQAGGITSGRQEVVQGVALERIACKCSVSKLLFHVETRCRDATRKCDTHQAAARPTTLNAELSPPRLS
jgi:hypothetical protein